MADTLEARGPDAGAAAKSDLDWRLFAALMVHTIAVNAVVALARVTISYRAIELDLSVIWIGVIASGFSLVPVFGAVSVGRFIDRGHDVLCARLGAAMSLLACFGLWWMPNSGLQLLAFSVALGFSHMFCMAAHQMIAVRSAGPVSREHVFGYHMIAIAAGQGLGPMLLGWLGHGAAVPPTGLLFTVALAGACASQLISFTLRPAKREPAHLAGHETVRVRDLLRTHGLAAVLLASIVTVTAFELMVVYLPLLATERQIDTHHVGWLLAARSAVSIISRFFYARLLMVVGRVRLMVVSMAIGAGAFVLLGLPLPVPTMYLAVVLMGFGLGIASTLTFSEVVVLAPVHARATALSLRVTGNRIGQLLVPALASVVAQVTGIGGVMLILSGFLGASAAYIRTSLRR